MARRDFDADEIIRRLRGEIAEDVGEIALAALSNVVRSTPVGNPTLWQNPDSAPPGYVGGHARRNWLVSIDRNRRGVSGTPGAGGGEGAATAEAIGDGSRTIESLKDPGRRFRRVIIQNNVPYIRRLNNGWSEQAPANFVEKAVQAALVAGEGPPEVLP